jgi:hypothetical protein
MDESKKKKSKIILATPFTKKHPNGITFSKKSVTIINDQTQLT